MNNILTLPGNEALKEQVDNVLNVSLNSYIDVIFTWVMTVFNFLTTPATLAVLITIALIVWAAKFIKRKIAWGKMR